MLSGFQPDDLERITARAEEMLAHVEQLKDELDVVVGRGEAADGQVRVTAGASGRLIDVVLAPRVMGMDSRKLAEAVLRAAQEAQDEVAGKVDKIMAGSPEAGNAGDAGDAVDDEKRFAAMLESFEASMAERFRAADDQRRDDR
ncbi:YbaB/EbfC family nucleoid-associated protein [Nonomuraea fuscirosea]|jgi:DNA-binding protein YbaB|uniref:YbaB/EbfC family nucleoid-associated protein n=1 Tax=Nonomuraea fuscirosea TaxID=1291556 RepID=UPI002DDB55A5|nr:YbaB/EbfC family nucleoid-associated protein [Nonomuraea fuscirosea]WSA48972.1 YbaB/EbfC family nucleoid-associated protein [Nonomuraea fuscirosea]